MRTNGIKAHVFRGLDFPLEAFIRRLSEDAVWPATMLKETDLEVGFVIEKNAGSPIHIAGGDFAHAEIAIHPIDHGAVFFKVDTQVVEERIFGSPELLVGDFQGDGVSGDTFRCGDDFSLIASGDLDREARIAGCDFENEAGGVDIGGLLERNHIIGRNGLDPDRLPQAGKLRELASRHAFIGVVKIDENFMRLAGRAGGEFVRDSLEATFLRGKLNAIEIEGGFRANGFAMEEDFFASPVIRNLDRFAIPSTIIGFRQTTREGLRGRGNQRFFGKAIRELRRNRTVAQKIPLSVEIFPCRTGHRWPRIFRQRRG